MLTSAPFDDWWHAAYGLDVKIISPPHTVLALGFWGICIGALMMALARQSREESGADIEGNGGAAPWVVAYMSGILLTLIAIFTYEYQDRTLMHNSIMYRVMAIAMPFALVSAAVSTRLRWSIVWMAHCSCTCTRWVRRAWARNCNCSVARVEIRWQAIPAQLRAHSPSPRTPQRRHMHSMQRRRLHFLSCSRLPAITACSYR